MLERPKSDRSYAFLPDSRSAFGQEKWKADTLPAIIFADANGIEKGRVSMYLPPDKFLVELQAAVEKMNTRLAKAEPCPTE